MFLNIGFPMPHTFPNLYIQLNGLLAHVDAVTPKLYDQIEDIARDPQCALAYIIHHFNIERISKGLHTFPNYVYDQVYYSTYIDSSRYNTLIHYSEATRILPDCETLKQEKLRTIQIENALAKERLELQVKYGCYHSPNDIPITLLDCYL